MGKDDLVLASTTNTAEEIQAALQHGLDPGPDAATLSTEVSDPVDEKAAEEKPVDEKPADEKADEETADDEKPVVEKAADDKLADDKLAEDKPKPRKMDTRPRREDYASDEEFDDAQIGFKAKKRIDKVTWEREEKQRRIETLERENEELRTAKPAPVKEKDAPAPAVALEKPQAQDYDTHELWIEALSDFNDKTSKAAIAEAVNAALTKDRETREATEQEAANVEELRLYMAAKPIAAARYDDFDEVIKANGSMPLSGPMNYVMLSNPEVGHDIAYYLATHRAEALRIFQMNGSDQIREMGRLEERIERRVAETLAAGGEGEDAAVDPPPPPRKIAKVTQTPEPLVPVGARATRTSVGLEELSFDDYKAQRRQDEILRKKNRR